MRGAFSPTVCRLIDTRAGGRCEKCGTHTVTAERQHRRARGMGGTRRVDTGGAANGLRFCPDCHRWVEAHPHESLNSGWRIRQTSTPTEVPVRMWDGLFQLHDDGTRTAITQ